MKPFTSYPVQPLEALIRRELEQTEFVLPSIIRCAVKRHILFIVLDYGAIATVNSQASLKAIHRALSQCCQTHQALLLNTHFQGSVRCYWRQCGQHHSVARYTFRDESFSVAVGEADHPVRNVENTTNVLEKKSRPPSDVRLNVVQNVVQLGSSFPALWKTLKLNNWRWSLGLSLTAALGALGLGAVALGTYAWSRPCVASACTILEKAQAMNASLTFDATASVEDVAHTYTTLLDINYQLSQVPFWSPHYDEVKGVLETYETHTHLVSQVLGAQKQAQVAIDSSQSPPYPLHDWQATQGKWQDAIQTLEPVSQDTIVSPLVQTHLQDYSTKLQVIEQKMEQEKTALNKVRAARKFAQMAEMTSSTAVSVAQLQQVESYWQNALDRLTDVSSETMAYAEAEHLTVIYSPQLLAVRDRLAVETLAEQAYNQAIILAEQSTAFEQEQQWSLAVQHWQQALDHINQVPANTIYSEQVFPLVTSYTTALSNAQGYLKKAVALQNAQEELAQRCSAMPDFCESVTVDHDLHVRLAAHSDDFESQELQPAGSPGLKSIPGTSSDSNSYRLVSQDINVWLSEVSAVGKTMRVAINVYNPDGSVFGIYSPQSASFVRIATPVETKLDTTVVSVTPEQS